VLNGRIESYEDGKKRWVLSVPLSVYDRNNRRSYRLPSRAFMNKSVLVVGMNPEIAASLRAKLRYFHYEVDCVLWRELDRRKHYDIALIDQSAVNELSDRERLKKVDKIVLVSDCFEKINEGAQAEDFPVLHRPLTQQEMLLAIVRLFGGRTKLNR
jgi:hypothetical protein